MTANPNWIEINRELFPQQTVVNRPDLVSHIFQLKKGPYECDPPERHLRPLCWPCLCNRVSKKGAAAYASSLILKGRI